MGVPVTTHAWRRRIAEHIKAAFDVVWHTNCASSNTTRQKPTAPSGVDSGRPSSSSKWHLRSSSRSVSKLQSTTSQAARSGAAPSPSPKRWRFRASTSTPASAGAAAAAASPRRRRRRGPSSSSSGSGAAARRIFLLPRPRYVVTVKAPALTCVANSCSHCGRSAAGQTRSVLLTATGSVVVAGSASAAQPGGAGFERTSPINWIDLPRPTSSHKQPPQVAAKGAGKKVPEHAPAKRCAYQTSRPDRSCVHDGWSVSASGRVSRRTIQPTPRSWNGWSRDRSLPLASTEAPCSQGDPSSSIATASSTSPSAKDEPRPASSAADDWRGTPRKPLSVASHASSPSAGPASTASVPASFSARPPSATRNDRRRRLKDRQPDCWPWPAMSPARASSRFSTVRQAGLKPRCPGSSSSFASSAKALAVADSSRRTRRRSSTPTASISTKPCARQSSSWNSAQKVAASPCSGPAVQTASLLKSWYRPSSSK